MIRPRLATFRAGGRARYGLITDDGAVDLSARHPEWPTLREVIEAGALGRLAQEGAGAAVDFAAGAFTYEIPIPAPEKIICVGVNFP
ncbi:MAG: 2-hydroxyhepta-2,4-diene-1,7-dioate isomerase, partial [Rhizobiaceae bacterium]